MATRDELLINQVQNYPFLFDCKDKRHKNKQLRTNAWEAISKSIDINSNECQERWKQLRDRYRKEKQNKKPPSGSAKITKKKWILFDLLSFLDPYLQEKMTWTSLTSEKENLSLNESNELLNSASTSMPHITFLNCENNIDESILHSTNIEANEFNKISQDMDNSQNVEYANRDLNTDFSFTPRRNSLQGSKIKDYDSTKKRRLDNIDRAIGKILNEDEETTPIDHLMQYIGGLSASAVDLVNAINMPMTPCLLACEMALSSANYILLIVGIAVIEHIGNFADGFLLLFAAYFIFNIKYMPTASAALEFIQSARSEIRIVVLKTLTKAVPQ